jgi:protein-S-isoprenylcysteine O-methyltransferase Ste14
VAARRAALRRGGEGTRLGTLLVVTLAAQAALFAFSAISLAAPDHRIWPPPARQSWQFYTTWFLSWVSLSGVFLLAVLDESSLGLPLGLRLGAGLPLLGLGAWLILAGFRALGAPATLGLASPFVRSGAYRWSRNPQYLGTCLYLASLAVLSGSPLAAVAALAVGAWFALTPFVEEPWLRRRFGAEYEAYCRAVPRFFSLRALRSRAFRAAP